MLFPGFDYPISSIIFLGRFACLKFTQDTPFSTSIAVSSYDRDTQFMVLSMGWLLSGSGLWLHVSTEV